ncbi:MAG: cytochrome P460 family protein [Bacteroidia bacterium]|nr:cytochrome P460 family protein [Bacteroidia bacterium]
MKTRILAQMLLVAMVFLLASCKKEEEKEKKANTDLYCEINAGPYAYYSGTPVITEGLGGAHGFMKVRFNSVAQTALDSSGKLPTGSAFPNGSVIVKEVYNSLGGGLQLYAVMKKENWNEYAGSSWLWGEYRPGGEVVFSVAKKGNGCISCHSSPDHRDLTKVFDLH